MDSSVVQNAPQVDEAPPISVNPLDGGASGRCEADQESKVVVPREAIVPTGLTGMEEPNHIAAERITRGYGCVFVIVALLARKSQVCLTVRAGFGTGNNVFD